MATNVDVKVMHYAGTKVTNITPLVTSLSCSGDISESARKCALTIQNANSNGARFLAVGLGSQIRVYKGATEFFRGVIFSTDIAEDGAHSITAWDYNYYLVKNTDTLKFVKKKASEIIASICKKYGISCGTIEDTGYVIPKLILRDKTLYDMITIALTETRKKTGRVFLLSNEKGNLILRERKNQIVRLLIADGANLLSATHSEDMSDLRNSVRMTGNSGEDAAGVTISDSASIKRYGLMRYKQHDGDKTNAQLKPVASQLLKELNKVATESNVSAIGDTSVRAGKSVQISQKTTGLSGGFYVITDEHQFDANGQHTMSLKVSKTLDITEMEYEPPEEATATPTQSKSSTGGGSTGKSPSVAVTGKRQAVVNLAQSYIGKLRYSFGGKNIPSGSGDCSGFTQFVVKKAAGFDLGGGTSVQVTKGTAVSKSGARGGDIVFFQGTYRNGVSHVGIVTRPGYCISLADSGCKEHSYTSGYWGNHFMQIRRVLP